MRHGWTRGAGPSTRRAFVRRMMRGELKAVFSTAWWYHASDANVRYAQSMHRRLKTLPKLYHGQGNVPCGGTTFHDLMSNCPTVKTPDLDTFEEHIKFVNANRGVIKWFAGQMALVSCMI